MANKILMAVAVAGTLASTSASAATNLIVNGSFEDSAATGDGLGGFLGFNHINAASLSNPALVITYNSTAGGYGPGGAYGELIPVDNVLTDVLGSTTDTPDAPGVHAAYFVDDSAVNEAITQLTALHPGHYEIGFSVYLPQNGANNPVNATFNGSIIGVNVANLVASQIGATNWYNISGVADVTASGYYETAFTYNSTGYPAKDFVIDRVYVVATKKAATYVIPPTPTAPLPEPATWAMMLAGFGLVGASMRHRKTIIVTA